LDQRNRQLEEEVKQLRAQQQRPAPQSSASSEQLNQQLTSLTAHLRDANEQNQRLRDEQKATVARYEQALSDERARFEYLSTEQDELLVALATADLELEKLRARLGVNEEQQQRQNRTIV
jgi:hypothetical protein